MTSSKSTILKNPNTRPVDASQSSAIKEDAAGAPLEDTVAQPREMDTFDSGQNAPRPSRDPTMPRRSIILKSLANNPTLRVVRIPTMSDADIEHIVGAMGSAEAQKNPAVVDSSRVTIASDAASEFPP